MKLDLEPEHHALRALVRDFAHSVVRPLASTVDRERRFPREAIDGARQRGLLGLLIPREYGGMGLDHLSFAIVIEELAVACASTSVIVDVHNSVAAEPILRFGSEEQKRRWLPRLASGEALGAFALTEPTSGSDAGSLRTRARRSGGDWVLSGTKTFITNIGEAGVYIVFARTGEDRRASGVSAFIVPAGTPGLRTGQVFKKMGLNGSPTGELVLEEARVPAANLLHEQGKGFGVAMRSLDSGRIGISGQALGIAQAALQETLAWPAQGNESDGPDQGDQFALADMATLLTAARQMTYHAAALCSAGLPFGREASMCKLFATDAAMEIAGAAVQLAGAHGGTKDLALERHFRDAKALQIYEGTNQIQKLVIGRYLGC